MNIHWKDWCWSWSYNTLATWREELTHWKRPWSWEILKVGGEGEDRGWGGWMESPTQWTRVWANFRRQWKGQGSLVCFSPWSCKESNTTYQRNNNNKCVLSHCSHIQFLATLWTVALQAPLSMGILQARTLKWVAMLSSWGFSQSRDWTHVS